MDKSQYLTDRFIVISLTLITAVFTLISLATENLQSELATLNNPIFLLLIIFGISLLIIPDLINIRKSRVSTPQGIDTFIDSNKINDIKFIAISGSDFTERSTLISQCVGLPKNHNQYCAVNEKFYIARILHEVGHSEFKDFLFTRLYIAVALISITFFIASSLKPPYYTGDPAYDLYTDKPNLPIDATIFYLTVLIFSVFRLIIFLRDREYRADHFAFHIYGANYLAFLNHQRIKNSYSNYKNNFSKLISLITHPSFSKRIEKLTSSTNNIWPPFLNGIQWAILFGFSLGYFSLPIASAFGFPSDSDIQKMAPYQLAILYVAAAIGAYGLSLTLTSVSKVQYSLMLINNKVNYSVLAFCFSFMLCNAFIMYYLVYIYIKVDSSPDFGKEASDILLVLYFPFWTLLNLFFNAIAIKTTKNRLKVTRYFWSWGSMLFLFPIVFLSMNGTESTLTVNTAIQILFSIFTLMFISLAADLFILKKRETNQSDLIT